MKSSTGNSNTAIGNETLASNTTGSNNVGIGAGVTGFLFPTLNLNTSGSSNTAIGTGCLGTNTTGDSNSALGYGCNSGNFTGSLILGRDAVATGNNQAVFGSVGTNAGSVTAEINASANVWNVVINGVARKILLA